MQENNINQLNNLDQMINQLTQFGLNTYEAKCYIALIQLGYSNGYQISKTSSIPRARIYDTLSKLIDKGIVFKHDGEQTTYTALEYHELIQKFKTQYNDTLQSLKTNFDQLPKIQNDPLLIQTFYKASHIIDKLEEVIKNANTLYISCFPLVYNHINEIINQFNLNITIKGIVFEIEKTNNDEIIIHRETTYTNALKNEKWFIIINDKDEMVYGNDLSIKSQAYYTNDPTQIYLLKNFIWHDILVNQFVKNSEAEEDLWIKEKREVFFK